MSFTATKLSWELSTRSGSHKLVLLCIAHHQNDVKGVAWPSIDRIARMCCIGRRQVFDIIKDLTQGGEIERRSGMKTGQANRYVVTIGNGEGVQTAAPRGELRRTPTGAVDRTPPVQPAAPEALLNGNSELSTEAERGHSRAAGGVALTFQHLVDDGLLDDVAEELLDSLTRKPHARRFVPLAEWTAFKARVAEARRDLADVSEGVAASGGYWPGLTVAHMQHYERQQPGPGPRIAGQSDQAPISRQLQALMKLEALKQEQPGADDHSLLARVAPPSHATHEAGEVAI